MAVGTCHRVINVIISMIFGAGVMSSSIIALEEAPGTKYDNSRWDGITITAITISTIQMLTNIPYVMVGKRSRTQTLGIYTDNMWKFCQLFSSFTSFILFFLTFYLDDLQSADLRTNFWTQFKFDVDPKYDKAYMEALVVFTDFISSNFLATLGVVCYPKVSQLWNRTGPDAAIQMSISST